MSNENCWSINKNFPLPQGFSQILSSNLERNDPIRILGPIFKFDLVRTEGNQEFGYYFIYKDNFVQGGLWGLASGYCTRSFFKPSVYYNLGQNPSPLEYSFYSFKRSANIAARVSLRLCLAGLLFDFVEKQAAERCNASKTNTLTIFGALVVSAFTFRLSSCPRANAAYTGAILGGYLFGAKIPPAIFNEAWRRRTRTTN